MRPYPTNTAAHVASGGALLTHVLVWLNARDRADNSRVSLGLWTGADHQDISVGGTIRTYYGVGGMLSIDNLVSAMDLMRGDWAFRISPLHDQVIELVRNYDARLGAAECHLLYCDAASGVALDDPAREFRGTITDVEFPIPGEGQEATATVKCASDAWRLTRALTLKRSQAALAARQTGDLFRQYNDISGAVQVAWGEKVKK